MKIIDGIKFECIQCGKCCKWDGHVFLEDSDVTKMAEDLTDGGKEKFLEKYTNTKNKDTILKDKPNSKECVFLKDNKCSIYKSRPEQCITFPVHFTKECPGFQIEEDKHMNKMAQKVKDIYQKFASEGFERAITDNLYEDLRKNLKASKVASIALEGGVSMFFDQNRIKIASLDDLFAFNRVDDKHIIHKSSTDLWAIESDEKGDVHITRLFESGKPIKG
jgi:Fe-S-cluster containining protein